MTKMGENIKSLKKENDKLRDQVFPSSLITLTDYLSRVRPYKCYLNKTLILQNRVIVAVFVGRYF